MSQPVIELAGVEKAFKYFRLSDLTLEVEPGQVVGLVGPNGAGKSTTIRILMGMTHQDRGEVRVLGRTMPREQAIAKRDVGFVSEDMRLYATQTLAWHMRLVSSIYGSWDAAYAEVLLKRFYLRADRPIKGLSHGERVKATLLLTLARRPRLLLLDEPTTGLDPVARHEILAELMDVMHDERRAILFSSHNTQDVEQISDRIVFLDRGRIVEASDKETYLDRWRRLHLDLTADVALPEPAGVVATAVNGRIAVVTTNAYTPELEAVYERAGARVREVQRMTLEEIFVATVMHNRKEHAA
jgi:ABC-2 type transport system ATP-binding protein